MTRPMPCVPPVTRKFFPVSASNTEEVGRTTNSARGAILSRVQRFFSPLRAQSMHLVEIAPGRHALAARITVTVATTLQSCACETSRTQLPKAPVHSHKERSVSEEPTI